MWNLPEFNLLSVAAFGGGGLAAGLLGLLACRRGVAARGPGLIPALLGLAAFGACAAAGAGLPELGPPALALAGLLLLFAAARSDRLAAAAVAVLAWVRTPRGQWAALAVGCPVAALAALPLCGLAPDATPEPVPPPIRTAAPALTDRGREVPLAEVVPGSWSAEALADAERRELRRRGLLGRAVQTAPADWSYNCHAWVFTGAGRGMPDADVDVVLQDNGYSPVPVAAAGDLAVYRDQRGAVCHTGVVRAAADSGPPLVESKWGWMGRYLHTADVTPYGGVPQYYRSPRPGHRLRSPAPASAAAAASVERGAFLPNITTALAGQRPLLYPPHHAHQPHARRVQPRYAVLNLAEVLTPFLGQQGAFLTLPSLHFATEALGQLAQADDARLDLRQLDHAPLPGRDTAAA